MAFCEAGDERVELAEARRNISPDHGTPQLGPIASGLGAIGEAYVTARRQDLLIQVGYELEEAMPWADRKPAICA